MGNVIKKIGLLKRFLKDTSGAFSMMWAVSMTGVIISVGATYDIAQITKAKALAQYAADNMALAASVAVDIDNDDRYANDTPYGYDDIGGAAEDFTGTMQGRVLYDIVDSNDSDNTGLDEDDKSRLLARATVWGTYTPAFMSIVPGITTISIRATADVAYAAREGSPASIFFVVDNSGSMGDPDNNGVAKITSLETSMKSFMDTLEAIESYGSDIFRTALYPFAYNLIASDKVDPAWAVLSDSDINDMWAGGGTRSTAALHSARTKFTLENAIHDNVNGEDNPLKFLIFMSDGANNDSTTQQVCTTEQVWVPTSTIAQYWIDTYPGENNRKYYSYQNWFDSYLVYYAPQTVPGHNEDQQVCNNVPYSPVNEASLVHCNSMKASGVRIYSIAYDVDEDERALAEEFMKECSSNHDADTDIYTDNGYYKYAENGADLQSVFDEIGNSVVTEVIRVKH